MSEPWINAQEAAEHLGVPASWLYAQAERSGVPRHRLGKGSLWRYRRSELDAWVQAGDPA